MHSAGLGDQISQEIATQLLQQELELFGIIFQLVGVAPPSFAIPHTRRPRPAHLPLELQDSIH